MTIRAKRLQVALACILCAGCTGLGRERNPGEPCRGAGSTADAQDRDTLLSAPMAAPRFNFFHAALLVPSMQTAKPLSPGKLYGRLASNHAHSHARRNLGGFENQFDSVFHEWLAPELRWGALPDLELSFRTAYGGWDEVEDRFGILDNTGQPIVRYEELLLMGMASKRGETLTRIDLGAKWRLQGDSEQAANTALALQVKVPLAPDRDLSSAGTWDVGTTLLETVDLGSVALHANAGVVFPLGGQNLFNLDQDIELDPFLQGAIGGTWEFTENASLGLQLEANSSAFRDVEFLREAPISLVGGLRFMPGNLVLEAGGGGGLNPHSSYGWQAFFAVGYLF